MKFITKKQMVKDLIEEQINFTSKYPMLEETTKKLKELKDANMEDVLEIIGENWASSVCCFECGCYNSDMICLEPDDAQQENIYICTKCICKAADFINQCAIE